MPSTPAQIAFYEKLIEQFRARREELGITQSELAGQMGISDGLVAKWESGARTPNSYSLACWALALELDLICLTK